MEKENTLPGITLKGILLTSNDDFIIDWFRSYGYNVYKDTFQIEEKCYHNQYKTVTKQEWVVEHPHTKEAVPMREMFESILVKQFSKELLSGISKSFINLCFNERAKK